MRTLLCSLVIALFIPGFTSIAAAEGMDDGMDDGMDHDKLHVAHGWARASLGQNPNSAAYVTIHNPTEEGDRLLGVSCADAPRCAVHNHVTVSDVTRMEAVENLDIAPGAHIEFKAGGYHIMMFDLTAPLVAGGETRITFSFENAGDMTATVPVLSMREAAERSRHSEHKKKHN